MSLLVVLPEPKTASAVFHNSTFDGVDATAYTFLSQPIGEKTQTKIVLAGIAHHTLTGANISSVLIGGVSSSLVTSVTEGALKLSLWQASVSSSSSVDISVSLDSTALRCGLGLWALTGASPTVIDTATYSSPGSTIATASIDIPESGAAVALHDGATNTTWTNITGDFNQALEGDPFSGGSKSFPITQTNLTIQAEDGVSSNRTMIIASWGPF